MNIQQSREVSTRTAPSPYVHVYSNKRLYVRKIRKHDIPNRYHKIDTLHYLDSEAEYYVTCNAYGAVDWGKTILYTSHNLVGTDNVFVVGQLKS